MLDRRAGIKKIQAYTLLKLCSEKKKCSVLGLEVKRLTQKLAEVRAAQEKDVVGKQAAKDTVVAREIAEEQVLALTEELAGVKTTHA